MVLRGSTDAGSDSSASLELQLQTEDSNFFAQVEKSFNSMFYKMLKAKEPETADRLHYLVKKLMEHSSDAEPYRRLVEDRKPVQYAHIEYYIGEGLKKEFNFVMDYFLNKDRNITGISVLSHVLDTCYRLKKLGSLDDMMRITTIDRKDSINHDTVEDMAVKASAAGRIIRKLIRECEYKPKQNAEDKRVIEDIIILTDYHGLVIKDMISRYTNKKIKYKSALREITQELQAAGADDDLLKIVQEVRTKIVQNIPSRAEFHIQGYSGQHTLESEMKLIAYPMYIQRNLDTCLNRFYLNDENYASTMKTKLSDVISNLRTCGESAYLMEKAMLKACIVIDKAEELANARDNHYKHKTAYDALDVLIYATLHELIWQIAEIRMSLATRSDSNFAFNRENFARMHSYKIIPKYVSPLNIETSEASKMFLSKLEAYEANLDSRRTKVT